MYFPTRSLTDFCVESCFPFVGRNEVELAEEEFFGALVVSCLLLLKERNALEVVIEEVFGVLVVSFLSLIGRNELEGGVDDAIGNFLGAVVVVVVSCLSFAERNGLLDTTEDIFEVVDVVSCLLFTGRNADETELAELFEALAVSVGGCFFIVLD